MPAAHKPLANNKPATQLKDRPPKLVHGTSVHTAFQQLRELIVHGKLSPGTWIVEGDLAKRLHISRTPIRAALNKLQQEGYVREHRMANKSRMIVAPLTKRTPQSSTPSSAVSKASPHAAPPPCPRQSE